MSIKHDLRLRRPRQAAALPPLLRVQLLLLPLLLPLLLLSCVSHPCAAAQVAADASARVAATRLFNDGNAAISRNDWQAAHALLSAAVQLWPDLHGAQINLAQLDGMLGRRHAARDRLERVADAAERDGDTASAALALNNLATTYLPGSPTLAHDLLLRALVFDNVSYSVHLNLGLALEGLAQPVAACREYGIALALEPSGASALAGLGSCLFHQRRHADALHAYKRLLVPQYVGTPEYCTAGSSVASIVSSGGGTQTHAHSRGLLTSRTHELTNSRAHELTHTRTHERAQQTRLYTEYDTQLSKNKQLHAH